MREALQQIRQVASGWFNREPLAVVTHGGVQHAPPIAEIVQIADEALSRQPDQWTSILPRNAGWYWWRQGGSGEHKRAATVVHLFYDGHDRAMRIDTVTGKDVEGGWWWGEPLPEPDWPTAKGE